ncbi:hypothetical protein M5689_006883 [Euphorbia peplus]|nr:hypothetical protein M5689_006883 [Euphorbia peplus]
MRAEVAVEANVALDAAKQNVRAEATTNVDENAAEDSEKTPLKRNGIKVVSKRKHMRKKDFILTSNPELEEEAHDDADEGMLDAEDTEDMDAHVIEDLSDDPEQEPVTAADVVRTAKAFAEDTDSFMDDVLLGQGRSSEMRTVHDVFERLSHIYAEPFATYIPPTSEDFPFSAPENPLPSPVESSPSLSPVHTTHIPSPPHSSPLYYVP